MREETFRARIERIKRNAAGQWMRILADAGIPHEQLEKPNRPCPLCGGHDRFTFFKKEEGGGWYCRGCGHGDGIALLQEWRHEGFVQTLDYLERALGLPPMPDNKKEKRRTKSVADPEVERRKKLEAFWNEAEPLDDLPKENPVKQYLNRRKLLRGRKTLSSELRSHPLLDYWETQVGDALQHERWPAMVARVTDEKGHLVSLHRTYLTPEGRKAPVSAQKKLAASAGENGLIRLFPVGKALGIAEGIETALAATLLFGLPVWSAICANGFAKISELPDGVEKLVIFGDNDRSFTGQSAAWALAHRLRRDYPDMAIEVKIPETEGEDWHDVWCRSLEEKNLFGQVKMDE